VGDELGGRPQSTRRQRRRRPSVRPCSLLQSSILSVMRSILARAEMRLERIYGPSTTRGKPSLRLLSTAPHLSRQPWRGSRQPRRDSRFRRINYSYPLYSKRIGTTPKVIIVPVSLHLPKLPPLATLQALCPTKAESNRAPSLKRTRTRTHNRHTYKSLPPIQVLPDMTQRSTLVA
jgi:hypothetical protein